jgi:hypothetical protein
MFSNFRAIDCAREDVPSYFAGCLCSATFDELALPGPATTTLECTSSHVLPSKEISRGDLLLVRMQSRTEARIFATHTLREMPNAKLALRYQNDDFGKDFINGLRDVLSDRCSSTVPAIACEFTGPTVASQVHASTPHQRSQTTAARTPLWPCDTNSSSQQNGLLV